MLKWFKKQKQMPDQPTLPAWHIWGKGYVSVPIEECANIHLRSLLLDVREVIPEEVLGEVFIAGGFASHLAGITDHHTDIDLFCLTKDAFMAIDRLVDKANRKDPTTFQAMDGKVDKNGLPEIPILERYSSKLAKCLYKGCAYDLVDYSNRMSVLTAPDMKGLLNTFDFSWGMAGVDLNNNTLTYHETATLPYPFLNVSRAEEFPLGTSERLKKYSDRLVLEPDQKKLKDVLQYVSTLPGRKFW